MDDIIDGKSADLFGEDKITKFLRCTSNSDMFANPLVRWRGNSPRFTHITKAAQSFLSMQESSVTREVIDSISENLISAERSSLSEKSITGCTCVRSWESFLESVSK